MKRSISFRGQAGSLHGRQRRARGLHIRPVLGVLGALLDPAREQIDLARRELLAAARRRHPLIVVGRGDPLDHGAFRRLARHDRCVAAQIGHRVGLATSSRKPSVPPFPLFGIRPVALGARLERIGRMSRLKSTLPGTLSIADSGAVTTQERKQRQRDGSSWAREEERMDGTRPSRKAGHRFLLRYQKTLQQCVDLAKARQLHGFSVWNGSPGFRPFIGNTSCLAWR